MTQNGTESTEAELAALKIILSNVLARLVLLESRAGSDVRDRLAIMSDQCKLAAEHTMYLGPDRGRFVGAVRTYLDEFFKGITTT